MKRILFADDEQKILDGLRRMLRHQRKEWDMVFVNGGQQALDAMAEAPFDVLVTDMRMPGIDGAELLTRVQEQYPGTVRIVLSGYTELEATLRAVPVAHQFLTKPCDSELLRSVVNRTCSLQDLLSNEKLKSVLGKIETLPALPKVYNHLTSALVDMEVTVDEVADIVEQDQGISAKILQLVNSSFFAVAKSIGDIKHAVSYLGMNMLKNLALSMEVFREFKKGPSAKFIDLEAEQNHSVLTARIAQKLIQDKMASEHAFMAGMLHDIGRLILATSLPAELEEICKIPAPEGTPLIAKEQKVLGVTHAEIGGYLLGIWGMPYPIVEAVSHHHMPSRTGSKQFDVLGAIHVADFLAREQAAKHGTKLCNHGLAMDMKYLEACGKVGQIDEWRDLAEEIAEAFMAAPQI